MESEDITHNARPLDLVTTQSISGQNSGRLRY